MDIRHPTVARIAVGLVLMIKENVTLQDYVKTTRALALDFTQFSGLGLFRQEFGY